MTHRAKSKRADKQISKIYRVGCAFDKFKFDSLLNPFQIERLTGVSRETVLGYCHNAIFFQNFWPRIALSFAQESPSINNTGIIKKSFPPAFDLYNKPDERIMLRLLALGAYRNRYVRLESMQLSSDLVIWLRGLRESKLIDIKGDVVVLTNNGLSAAFNAMDKYSSLRADCFTDIMRTAKKLNHKTMTTRLNNDQPDVNTYCYFAPNDRSCQWGLALPPYLELSVK